MIDVQTLKERLLYEPETGVFTWKSSCGAAKAGSTAGSVTKKGHRHIGINGKEYLAHRLAWLFVTGSWPEVQIDHINGLRDDNRWANLRLATNKQNQENIKLPSDNTSGFRGVSFHKRDNRWVAQVRHNGKLHFLGYFSTAEEADLAARLKRAELFTHDSGRAIWSKA